MANENDLYINRIEELLKDVDNQELVELVNRLINERTYLAETINIDPLTGLYNRRVLQNARDVGAVIMCDIDYFKTVNDSFGHDTGDIVIKKVAQIIMNNVRIGDIVCRYGGDEYLILFSTYNQDVVKNRIMKICDDVKRIIKLPDFQVTLSVGVSFAEQDEDIETMITKADKALYQSKENGKNQISYYEPEKVLTK